MLKTLLNNLKTLVHKDMCTPMFITALVTVAKSWEQPRCPPRDDWLETLWSARTREYHVRKDEIGRL